MSQACDMAIQKVYAPFPRPFTPETGACETDMGAGGGWERGGGGEQTLTIPHPQRLHLQHHHISQHGLSCPWLQHAPVYQLFSVYANFVSLVQVTAVIC